MFWSVRQMNAGHCSSLSRKLSFAFFKHCCSSKRRMSTRSILYRDTVYRGLWVLSLHLRSPHVTALLPSASWMLAVHPKLLSSKIYETSGHSESVICKLYQRQHNSCSRFVERPVNRTRCKPSHSPGTIGRQYFVQVHRAGSHASYETTHAKCRGCKVWHALQFFLLITNWSWIIHDRKSVKLVTKIGH